MPRSSTFKHGEVLLMYDQPPIPGRDVLHGSNDLLMIFSCDTSWLHQHPALLQTSILHGRHTRIHSMLLGADHPAL